MPRMPAKAYRLPTHTVPERYDVHLDARLERDTFAGRVVVAVSIREPTTTLQLHARDLTVEAAELRIGDASFTPRTSLDADHAVLRLVFPEELPVGKALLELAYTGKVARNMTGLYLSKDGDEVCLATQCEATDARAIFPCFDEPAFKAPLAWHVTTDPENVVLANGPLAAKEASPDGVTWRFDATPPMSSYLAATAVGPFQSSQETVARDVPFRIWALAGKERLGDEAQAFAANLLPWYEDYFDQPYPFRKYDQVAVPSFSFGAMENVGLVVFRASLLLLDPATASWTQRRHIALVVAHEFAHMWFGNLVTMAWWDDLWLNEAFAEWIAHKATHELAPELEVWTHFHEGAERAYGTDALGTTHPIYFPVKTPAEATDLFDVITYQKGAAVLHMLEGFLGEDAFRRGLQGYMAAFAFGNARGADLWHHLGEASERPVERIMQAWINEPGHPVVRISAEPGSDGVALTLSQQRYRSTPVDEPGEAVWPVPLVLRYADGTGVHEHRHLLEAATETFDLPIEGSLVWLVGNAGASGFYRVALDDGLLAGALDHFDALDPSEQIGLLRDQWGLVRSGEQAIGGFVATLERALEVAEHYRVVEHIVGRLDSLEHLLLTSGDTEALAAYRRFVVDRLLPRLEALPPEPLDGEDPWVSQLRQALVSGVAGIGEHAPTLERVRAMAAREREDPTAVHPSLAGLAVRLWARFGGADELATTVATYEERRDAHASPQEVDRYLGALAAFREDDLVRRVLAKLDEGLVPNQSIGVLLSSMLVDHHGQTIVWEHIESRIKDLRAQVGDSWIARIVEVAGALPVSYRERVVRFKEEHLQGVADQSYARAVDRMDERAELEVRVLPDLVSWARQAA